MDKRRLSGLLAVIALIAVVAALTYFETRGVAPTTQTAVAPDSAGEAAPQAATGPAETGPAAKTETAGAPAPADEAAADDTPADEAQATAPGAAAPDATAAAPDAAAPASDAADEQTAMAAPDATAAAPEAGVPATTPAPAASAESEGAPTFDVVRVEPSGEAVVAGRAEPQSRVEVLDGQTTIATGEADASGAWAMAIEEPLAPGAHDLAVRTTSPDEKTQALSDQRVAVSVPEPGSKDVLVVINTPDGASRVLAVPDASESASAAKPAPATEDAQVAMNAPEAGTPPAASAPQASTEAPATETPASEAPVAEAPAVAEPAAPDAGAPSETVVASAPPASDRTPAASTPSEPPAATAEAPAASEPEAPAETAVASAPPAAEEAPAASAEAPAAAEPETGAEPAIPGEPEIATEPPAAPEPQVAVSEPEPPAPPPPPPPPTPKVVVSAVEADTTGALYVAGTATTPETVRIYLDGTPLGEAKPSPSGTWLLETRRDMPAGTYTVRVDQVGAAGTVVARSEVPFEREVAVATLKPSGAVGSNPGATLAGEVPQMETVIIKRGDNLWRIAREAWGRGIRWSTIYEANADQIRNPHWIYPGQVFVMPKGNAAWSDPVPDPS